MLELIIGRAGTGKTRRILDEISAAAKSGESGRILIVPEQYSHEAERELCGAAGDAMSLYAEAMSFTGLARRVESELGTGGRVPLDPGGRLLCMALSLDAVGARLCLYGAARRSPELQKELLQALDELKSAKITPEKLLEASAVCGGSLSLKLADLALIMGAYDAAAAMRSDPADRLTRLYIDLPRSGFGRSGHIYFDGFTDFTAQESEIVHALMPRGAHLTVCLTCDGLDGGSEVFELSRRTARALVREAKDHGVPSRVTVLDGDFSTATEFFAEKLFTYTEEKFDGAGAISLFSAETVTAECEFAAARAISLVRDGGCRWRDIAVAVRGFEDYRTSLAAAFSYYGVPLFTARKSDILAKPLPALIASAFEIISGGWEPNDVFAYLRTGLTGLSAEECDILENYCLMWDVKAPMWLSKKDWRLHPDGYGGTNDDASAARLSEVNRLRRMAAGPLIRLSEHLGGADTAAAKAGAVASFFDDLNLAAKLAERADMLEADGRLQAAAEYARLWDIVVSALEQFCEVLGDAEMDTDSFSRLFLLTLSQYDVGVIPVSLDMVTAGDMDRMRRRHIKHLIVLGASDERLPRGETEAGVFSRDERMALSERGLPLDAGDAEIWREFSLIYNCLSLPSDTLTLVMPSYSAEGAPSRPSFVMNRAKTLFDIPILPADPLGTKAEAKAPALELAALAPRGAADPLTEAASGYFQTREPERLEAVLKAAALPRGKLSDDAVRALYGDRLRLSASRADKLSSCRFAYFLQYGLRAKARKPAEFSPPEFGTFMHYVLEHVASAASSGGGFESLTDEKLDSLTDEAIRQYIRETLFDFAEKSPRFVYLFNRLTKSVRRIVGDMADELRNSDFRPLSFELDFSQMDETASVPLPGGGSLKVTGIADRVDGWVKDGTLYLRVVDYKTGKKSFSLSDIWHGMGLQMLLYLFTLQKNGETVYGREIVPAGVLYVPARDLILSESSDLTDDEIAEKRAAGLKRSGLVLDDSSVIRAMEPEGAARRLPIKWKDGTPTGEALASAERLGLLSRHIDETLTVLANELRKGSIAANPYFKGSADNACQYCDYAAACRFSEGEDGDRRRYLHNLNASEVWNRLEGGGSNG
ncbi:MAG: ATP-dependent nuclease subunit B [Clostridia bacterium]|nr:ATP-dependent nuclease subunit B [Clostridia bacterium]